MGPYKKQQNSNAIDDGWTIEDGDGAVIAHLDTETMADAMLGSLRSMRLAGVTWCAEDVISMASQLGYEVDEDFAAELLDDEEDKIQCEMMAAGAKVIEAAILDAPLDEDAPEKE